MTTNSQRELIHKLAQQDLTSKEIAEHLNLSKSVVDKWRARLKKGVQPQVK